MNWFYRSGRKEFGPVNDTRLEQLLRAGVINQETLVWHIGQSKWRPLGIVRLLGSGTTPPVVLGTGLRMGRELVVQNGGELPDRCVLCNAPANGFRLRRRVYWHEPWLYLLLLLGWLPYIIAGLCMRESALLRLGLCRKHRLQRRWAIAVSWIFGCLGLAVLFGGGFKYGAFVGLSGLVLLAAAFIWGNSRAGVLSASRVDGGLMWLKGADPGFLNQLPELRQVVPQAMVSPGDRMAP